MQFTQVGTASSVRDSDGCAVSLEYSFPANIQRIYITTRALNVKAGTLMHVEWDYQGQSTHTEDWTVPNDDADFCTWFYIEPTGAQFASGDWSVSLTANGIAGRSADGEFHNWQIIVAIDRVARQRLLVLE